MLIFLNEPIAEFIKKYFVSKPSIVPGENKIDNIIKEIDASKSTLNKSQRDINDEGLEKISKIRYNNLKNLILASNNINNIKSLINFEFGNTLEQLNLNNNKIKDIKPLEKIKFTDKIYKIELFIFDG